MRNRYRVKVAHLFYWSSSICYCNLWTYWSQWPRVLRRGFVAACLLGLWIRIPPGGMDVCLLWVLCVVQVEVSATSWALVQGSPTECRVSKCVRESSTIRRPWTTGGLFFASVRPYKWNSSGPTGRIVMKFYIWLFFENPSRKSKMWQEKRVLFMNTHVHLWQYLAELFLNWEMFQTKVLEKIKTHILFSITFFFLEGGGILPFTM